MGAAQRCTIGEEGLTLIAYLGDYRIRFPSQIVADDYHFSPGGERYLDNRELSLLFPAWAEAFEKVD